MDRLAAYHTIAAQARCGELTFPTHVRASLRLQQALADPDCHSEAATRLVQADPLLAARSVAIANSVAYRRNAEQVTSVRTAVQRLGVRTLQSLVAALIVRQIGSQITDPALQARANQLWQHTAHVAALAQVLARRVSRHDPDSAMFAGIVHEVGGFYLLARAAEFPGLLDGDPGLWCEQGEALVGRSVMAQLLIPEPVSQAVELMWRGLRALPPETLGDVVLLADDLAPVDSPLYQPAGATTALAAHTIDFSVGEGTLQAVMAESALEVRSLYAVLML